MNAIVVRSVILIAVVLLGAMKLRTIPSGDVEQHSFVPATSDTIHEASTDWSVTRYDAKHRLAGDLIAHRRSLWEVAALFREINNYPKNAPASLLPKQGPPPMTYVPQTEEERQVLQVIGYVAARLYADPKRALEEIVRLEKIFLDELERSGVISLPNPATLVSVEEILRESRLIAVSPHHMPSSRTRKSAD